MNGPSVGGTPSPGVAPAAASSTIKTAVAEGKPKLDVAIVGPPTEDGQGHRVLRIRDDGASIGEVRPIAEGKPIAPSAEVVSLDLRPGAPANVRDVKVLHAPSAAASAKGPAKVATNAYRDGWDRLFGAKSDDPSTVN